MRIRWTEPAVADLTGICDYLQEYESPTLARTVAQAVYRAAQLLSKFPMKGRIGREADTRELVISRYPYIVVYRLQADSVHILRILHASQQLPIQ
jgi:toxin ParE1/3/4